MAKNFYTGREAVLASGAKNLVDIVSFAPSDYGVPPERIESYADLTASFIELLRLAREPATRTTVVVAEKNALLKSLTTASVSIARVIAANPAVSNAQLLALNLNPRITPRKQSQPMDAPSVAVVAVVGRIVKLRVRDPTSESKRTKALGAIGAQIYTYIGDHAPVDPRDYQFQCMTTRTIADIRFSNSVPSGATVWVTCNWVGTRGQAGRGSTPMNFTLQGGAITAAAA